MTLALALTQVKQSTTINYLPEDFKSGNSAATTQLAARVKMAVVRVRVRLRVSQP